MCGTDPRLVMTRDRMMTIRYASFCCTRESRSGRISSAAVAIRMVPVRCRVPASSTYPTGSTNSLSVWNISGPLHLLAGELAAGDVDLVAAADQVGFGDLGRPGVVEVPPCDLGAGHVVEDDAAVA